MRDSANILRNRRGIALILVLSCLVLLSILVLAFLASVGTDLQTSKFYANGSSAKLLAQSATDLVMAEIHDATANGAYCWASQPGMIRTYDNSGNVVGFYKLYSDDNMNGTGVFDHTQTLVPDGTSGGTAWYAQKGVYVDLNQPVAINGSNQYPIVDGDSNDLVTAGTAASTAMGAPATAKVIGPLLTSGPNVNCPQVNGFWVTSTAPVDPSAAVPDLAPMPVKWLYVLKDGSIAVPDSNTGGTTVTFNNSPVKPTAPNGLGTGNPIVGRMAFWTDDETSKININTAAEGAYNTTTSQTSTTFKTSFNDTPRVSTQFDLNLANCPAYQNEFQRYPGHPATVSLSTVLGNLTTDANYPENIYSVSNASPGLAPRTIAGGSLEASVTSWSSGGNTQPALSLLANRLYASVDELFYLPTLSGTNRKLTNATLGAATEIDQTALKKARFFLTANSRAPDVTLFNTPRVGMWPINSTNDAAHRTAYDKLIAFCGTVGGGATNPYLYYFQRSNYLSQTEWTDIARNKTLLSYLRTLGTTSIPGFGGTFSAKYSTTTGTGSGTELDQILMETFDYIRTTNLYDTSLVNSGGSAYAVNNSNATAGGEVVPSYDSTRDVKGFGRMETISQMGLIFINAADATHQQVINYDGTPADTKFGPALTTGKTARVQAAVLFSLFDPSEGFTGLHPGVTLKVSDCTLAWDNGTMFPNIVGATATCSSDLSQGWSGNLGADPIRKGEYNATGQPFFTTLPITSTGSASNCDFAGGINITGYLTVQVIKGTTVIQTIKFTVPSSVPQIPLPAYVGPVQTDTGTPGTGTFYAYPGSFSDLPGGKYIGRWDMDSTKYTTKKFNYFTVASGDSVASLVPVNGDLRLIAARTNIDDTTTPSFSKLFGAHWLWGQQWAHCFVENWKIHPTYGATRGQLVASASAAQFYWQSSSFAGLAASTPYLYAADTRYCLNNPTASPTTSTEPLGWGTTTVPPATKGGVTAGDIVNVGWSSANPPGDWDNGIGSTPDGPYINKPDEGQSANATGAPAYFTADTNEVGRRVNAAYFSPARQIPSAVMLGSLPTGVIDNRPWQTLLFHPDSTGKHVGNKGVAGNGTTLATAPPDYLYLDLFNMPVVEPYAISEPLSTAGRINMNYLMVPFTYINRDTGVRAVLASQQMLAIPNSYSKKYKQDIDQTNPAFAGASYTVTTFRFPVNIGETLKGFAARFSSKDIFRSSSEICSLPLIPTDPAAPVPTFANIATYWQTHQLTGDNSLERPYANIYPLLTTKSNTFTIHFRVQTLKPAATSGATYTTWREGTDVITGEYRGSQTIERYVDPNDSTLVDCASNAGSNLAGNYKFRIVSTRQFAP